MIKFLSKLFGFSNTKKKNTVSQSTSAQLKSVKTSSKPTSVQPKPVNTPPKSKPKRPPKKTNARVYELSPEEQRKQYIHKVISNLSAIHKLKETQVEIRNAAYEELASMGAEAEIAIPKLIPKVFNKNAKERLLARETLEKIDVNWIKNKYTQDKIPFLIKQLEKEQTIANKAVGILAKMGIPAVTPLLQILKNNASVDKYLQANVIKTLSDIKPVPDELKPCLINILHTSDNSNLIEIAYEKLSDLGGTDSENIKTFIERHGNDTEDIKNYLLDVIHSGKNISQESIAYLFNSLSNKYETIRTKSIEILSTLDSQITDDFYAKVVNTMGSPTQEDIKSVFEKISFWSGADSQAFRKGGSLYWYYLELQEALDRPTILLNSVLKILHTKKQCREDLIDKLMDTYDIYQREEVNINVVKVLAEATLQKEKIADFLLHKLPKAPDKVATIILESLNKLNRKWIQQRQGIQAINAIIDNLEGDNKAHSMILLNELGESAIPQLNERLANAKTRYMLQVIIEVLENFHKGSITTLPVLHKLQKQTQNLNTLKAIERLVQKIDSNNESD